MRSLALIALAACSTAFRPRVVYVVAPAAHAQMRGDRCEPPQAEPALDCARYTLLRYDGCHWGCSPWFGSIERQSECGDLVVNGYRVTECDRAAVSPFSDDGTNLLYDKSGRELQPWELLSGEE